MSQGQYLWIARRSLVMHGVPRCLSLRIGLLSLLATLVLTHTVSPILAEPTGGGTLKFVTANDLKVRDPFWTTAYISRNLRFLYGVYSSPRCARCRIPLQPVAEATRALGAHVVETII